MKIRLDNFNLLINDEKYLYDLLETTKKNYRPYDPGQYLYNLLMNKRREEIFNEDYLTLLYTTLIAWNMNWRGAKLAEFNKFKDSILKNKEIIASMSNLRIEKTTEKESERVLKITRVLFGSLELVDTQSPLVTFSKTLHFLLPNLFVPIDRKYTIKFFYKSDVPTKDKQFQVFEELYPKFSQISKKYDLARCIDSQWNRNIPKIIDNAIIGWGMSQNTKQPKPL